MGRCVPNRTRVVQFIHLGSRISTAAHMFFRPNLFYSKDYVGSNEFYKHR